jgi:gamma-glutamylcyclotransferase (GGCT)/AIG2-like uncharacterized protein YtfP
MIEYLFVYGTLRSESGHPMARWLTDRATLVGQATVRGRLYLLGSYPGMKSSAGSEDLVRGELYRLRDPLEAFQTLDPYEGSEYERTSAVATLVGGEPKPSWVYLYRGQPAETSRIQSGDYFAR